MKTLTFAAIAFTSLMAIQPAFAQSAKHHVPPVPPTKPVVVIVDADGDKDFVEIIHANGDIDASGGRDTLPVKSVHQ